MRLTTCINSVDALKIFRRRNVSIPVEFWANESDRCCLERAHVTDVLENLSQLFPLLKPDNDDDDDDDDDDEDEYADVRCERFVRLLILWIVFHFLWYPKSQ